MRQRAAPRPPDGGGVALRRRAGWRGASDGGIIIGTTTANSHGGGTITAAGIYVGSTLLNVPDYVFDDPGYKHLSMSYVIAFVKEHAHLPWRV